MGEWKGPKQGVGKKGKSGRKPLYIEKNKISAINKLWEKVDEKIKQGIELDDFEKELVKSLLPKTIKTDVDLTSGGLPIPILSGKSNQIPTNNSIKEAIKSKE